MKNIFIIFISIAFSLLSACHDRIPENVTVGTWGPQETTVGKVVNAQKNGKSAIWIEVTGLDYQKPGIHLSFNNIKEYDITVSKDLITSYVPDGVINKAGNYTISIEENSGRKTKVGTFSVKAR